MPNSVRVFDYATHSVRIQIVNNEPWFCLRDVCSILSIQNQSPERFQMDEKGVTKNVTLTSQGKQQLIFINEPNLYRVIFRSNKPEAKVFQNWVFEEVLPAIRKTGAYIPNRSIETITPEQYQSLRYIVWGIGNRFQKRNAAEFAAWRVLRQYAGVNRAQLIPTDQLNDCIAFLQHLQASLEPFKQAVSQAETRLFQRNFVLSDQDIRRIEQEANDGE
ncbi:BRO-N domain-containing protein [Vibrio penaeicida]|uniref:BRO-N domain-containing protein n=1 Tax=Vibrio penaeicida TaxID=104609 RepID=UPI000CE9E8DA|nr:BRO family protein [Vibrio penaeicida]